MKTYTSDELNKCLGNVFISREFTYSEYTEELLAFQNVASRIVMNADTDSHYRLSDVISKLEMLAAASGISSDSFFRNDITKLRNVEKEISISMSGKNAEDRVDRILNYVSRDNSSHYRNIKVSDGKELGEIDQLVLTDSGIILLEVKNAKSDITISPDGRIMYENEISYHNDSILKKLEKKRRLLEYEIRDRLQESDQSLPLHIDCRLVFSPPKGLHININNRCRGVKYNFASQIAHIVDEYSGSVRYSAAQISHLKEIISCINADEKPFKSNLNMPEIRNCFIDAVLRLCPPEAQDSENDKWPHKHSVIKKYFPLAAGLAASMAIISGAAVSVFTSLK